MFRICARVGNKKKIQISNKQKKRKPLTESFHKTILNNNNNNNIFFYHYNVCYSRIFSLLRCVREKEREIFIYFLLKFLLFSSLSIFIYLFYFELLLSSSFLCCCIMRQLRKKLIECSILFDRLYDDFFSSCFCLSLIFYTLSKKLLDN